MGIIVAIGGGEIGRPKESGNGNYPVETLEIDKRIIELTGKKQPKMLFVPTASSDSQRYCEVIEKYYGEKLGCEVDYLCLLRQKYSHKELESKILGADIIYVGGGNTLKMMNLWKKLGVDSTLKQAYEKNIVLCGVSAGSICWFTSGLSDSRKFSNPNNPYIKVSGLGFINCVHSPHYHEVEQNRVSELKRIMKKTTKHIGVALDNCCALEIIK